MIYSQLLALRKDVFCTVLAAPVYKLPNDALVDPLGVRGSNLVQKKGMNAENGLRPKKTQKKSRNVPKKRRDVPKKHTHSVIYSQLLALRKDVFCTVLVPPVYQTT